MDGVLFWLFAAVMVAASVLVVGQRNPMYSVLALILSFLALSGLYVLLGSPFLAAIQIIIYAGAIIVLFLFVVMLLNAPTEDVPSGHQARLIGGAGPRRIGAVLSLLLALQLVWAVSRLQSTALPGPTDQPATSVYDIGIKLFREYGFAFEATSVLILVAMVGAIILARKEK